MERKIFLDKKKDEMCYLVFLIYTFVTHSYNSVIQIWCFQGLRPYGRNVCAKAGNCSNLFQYIRPYGRNLFSLPYTYNTKFQYIRPYGRNTVDTLPTYFLQYFNTYALMGVTPTFSVCYAW